MKKSKLFDICLALESKEWSLFFKKYLYALTGNGEDLYRLSKFLRKTTSKSPVPEKVSDQDAWKAIFRNKRFSQKEFNYLKSQLTKLLEEFVGAIEYEDSLVAELKILEGLAKRRLEKNYHYRLKRIEQRLQKEDLPQDIKSYYAYSLAKIKANFFNAQNNRASNPHLEEQYFALQQFFDLRQLQINCTALNENRVLAKKLSHTLDKRIASIPPTPEHTQHLEIYTTLAQLLQAEETDSELFKSYLKLLKDRSEHVQSKELLDLYYYSINYCLYAINRGQREYADTLLELYQQGLDSGSFLLAGELSPWIYKNIVKLGLALRRYEWTENFITAYIDELPTDFRDDAYHFNLSDLYYHKKDYSKALELLNKVEFSDIFYKHGAKIMLLKIFYEKGEMEAFHSLLLSYNILLIREKKLEKNKIKPYKKFVQYAARMAKIQPYEKERLVKLQGAIKSDKAGGVSDRSWLLEQIAKKGKL